MTVRIIRFAQTKNPLLSFLRATDEILNAFLLLTSVNSAYSVKKVESLPDEWPC